MTASEILRELVAIASPSAVSNVPLLKWVAAFLEPLGWQVEWMRWTDEAGVPKANLIAWPGHAALPERLDLAFVCHTDTVPYAAGWAEALTLSERDGNLHGCGACDVKGSLACFLDAAAGCEQPASLILILTADEEVGCHGTERLLADPKLSKLRVGSALVSEPTSLRPGVAGKGYGLARVTVEGREAHSAFPGMGVSAVSLAARLIARIEDAFAVGDVSDALFDPPRTTVNIGVIEGGSAKNILAGHCSFLVEWRAIPEESAGTALRRIQRLAAETEQGGASIAVEALRDEAGFAPVLAGPLRQKLSVLLDGKPIGISFGSEASRLARIAEEVIVIGPGDMRTAHSDRECVPAAELQTWTEILGQLMRSS